MTVKWRDRIKKARKDRPSILEMEQDAHRKPVDPLLSYIKDKSAYEKACEEYARGR